MNRITPSIFSSQVTDHRRFSLDLLPSRSQQLEVVCGGVEVARSDYHINRRNFPYYAIEYVTRGKGDLTFFGEKQSISLGTVFSYGPLVPHEIVTSSKEPLVKYFITFTGNEAETLLNSCKMPPGHVGRVVPVTEVEGIFEEAISSGRRKGQHSGMLCSKLLECLAFKLLDAPEAAESPETLSYRTFERCHQYIQDNFLKLHNLEQIAIECHVDAAYLCRLFRRNGKPSPYRFLLRLKMNFAAELLQVPNTLVKQVAQQVGFDDQYHFTHAFKAVFGVPPDTFKRIR
jgi:AraC-like DNA-binding protein